MTVLKLLRALSPTLVEVGDMSRAERLRFAVVVAVFALTFALFKVKLAQLAPGWTG